MAVEMFRQTSRMGVIELSFSERNVDVTSRKSINPSSNRENGVIVTFLRRRPKMDVFAQTVFQQEKRFSNRVENTAVVLVSNTHIFCKTLSLFYNSSTGKVKRPGNMVARH